jgi:hypothetical protein
MSANLEYDQRSLQHEQHMLDLYRQRSNSDGGLLQPLANACWRASAFDWRIKGDSRSIRRLWEEAARALAEGFVRKRAGFECNHNDLFLALHLSIAARNFDLVRSLMLTVPTVTSGVRGRRTARSPRLLLEGYLLTVRAVIERRKEHARAAQSLLNEAWAEADHEWWREQFPSDGETAWRITEHEAVRGLLSIIARLVLKQSARWESNQGNDADLDMSICMEFMSAMDEVLLALDQFVESEINHRPKLYVWLPGIALSILAERTGLSWEWLEVRHEDNQAGYTHLPLNLVTQ